MSQDLLRQELETKKRALGEIRIQLARYGISAPVNLIMDEQDLAKDVRAIERELGAEQTLTIQERRQSAPTPRYEPPPTPEPVYQARIAQRQTVARQSDIDHQMGLLKIHRRNLALYREQARYHGGIAASPLATQNGILDAKTEIARIKQVLRGYGVDIDDLSGDE